MAAPMQMMFHHMFRESLSNCKPDTDICIDLYVSKGEYCFISQGRPFVEVVVNISFQLFPIDCQILEHVLVLLFWLVVLTGVLESFSWPLFIEIIGYHITPNQC